jgi:PAS domain S-box-containing protein
MPPVRSKTPAAILRGLGQALDRIYPDTARPENTLRKRAEAVLVAVREIPAAVLIANNRGHFIDANAAATDLTWYSRRELLRMSVWDLTPPQRRGLGQKLWQDFLARWRVSGEYQIRRKDGRLVEARYVAVANVLPGVHVSALASFGTRVGWRERRRPPFKSPP